jgi:GT2 family glycosyltransferase
MPKVSILIINYNGEGLAIECLKSLERQTFNDFEIIIVDNASIDGSVNSITSYLKKSQLEHFTQIICANRNLGFAGGNIEGLKYANGEYIALLNNDTEANPDWLKELVKTIDAAPDVGICASKMITYGTDLIDSAGDGFATLLKGFKTGEAEKEQGYNESRYVFGACAGAALYRRTMLQEIGFFDEDFFLIHEDTDLNFRAQLSGWKVLYVPSAVVYHKVRSSIGHMSDTAVYYTLRNSEFVRIKNIPCGVFLRCLPVFILGMMTEFIYFSIIHGRFRLYCRAKKDALAMLLVMVKKRKTIMHGKAVPDNYLINIMSSVFARGFIKAKLRKLIYG